MYLLHDTAANINSAVRTWTLKIQLLAVLSYHGEIQISTPVLSTKPAYVTAHCTLWCACHTYLHHFAMGINGNSYITILGSKICVNWPILQQSNQQPTIIFIYNNSSCTQHDLSFITLLIHHCHTHIKCIHTFKTNTIRSIIALKGSTAYSLYTENSGLLVCGVVSLNVLFLKFWRTTVPSESQEPPTQQLTVTSKRPACSATLMWQPKIWSFKLSKQYFAVSMSGVLSMR